MSNTIDVVRSPPHPTFAKFLVIPYSGLYPHAEIATPIFGSRA